MTFVCAPGHALLQGNKIQPLSPAYLVDDPASLPGSGTFTRSFINDAFTKQGISLKPKLATNYLETIKMMVSVGLGWSLLPSSMSQDPELVSLEIKGIQLSRSLGLVRHTQRTLSNAAREMMTLLAQHSDHDEPPLFWTNPHRNGVYPHYQT